MFVSLKPNAAIIGTDFSYSTDTQRMISLYTKSYNSMIVEAKALDMITMLNGMFTVQQIEDYTKIVLGYTDEKCQSLFQTVKSWDIVAQTDTMTNWGSDVNSSFLFENFSQYSISFPHFNEAQIDLAIMVAKYHFDAVRLSKDFQVTETVLEKSLILDYSDLGRKFSELMRERYLINTIVDEAISSDEDLIAVVSPSDSVDIALDNYTSTMKLSSFNLFDTRALDNSEIKLLSKNINVVSDIIFGIANGFFE